MTYIADVLNVDSHFIELVWLKLRSIRRQINPPRLPSVTAQHHVQLGVRVQDLSKAKTNCTDKGIRVTLHYSDSLQCRRILASERILINRAPSWIQTRKRLGERRKCVLGSGS